MGTGERESLLESPSPSSVAGDQGTAGYKDTGGLHRLHKRAFSCVAFSAKETSCLCLPRRGHLQGTCVTALSLATVTANSASQSRARPLGGGHIGPDMLRGGRGKCEGETSKLLLVPWGSGSEALQVTRGQLPGSSDVPELLAPHLEVTLDIPLPASQSA